MATIAFTFGSLGDIVALLQLAWSLRQTLSDVAGSSMQIRAVIADLDSFAHGIQAVKSALDMFKSMPASLRNALGLALQRAHAILLAMKSEVDTFNAKVASAAGILSLKEFWARCQWGALGGRTKVEAMRQRLSEQLVAIQVLLAASQTSVYIYFASSLCLIIPRIQPIFE
jgi:hypothetical protein